MIDPTGRLVQQTDLFVRTWIKDRIVPADGPMTLYTRVGDIFAYACLLLTALGLGWGAVEHGVRRRNLHVRGVT